MVVKTYKELYGTDLTIRDLVQDFTENTRTGQVSGFGGRLNIRPSYQREFVYEDDKRNEVIKTVLAGYPLNVMYWAKTPDGNFELMDGQQRTISICKYNECQYSVKLWQSDRLVNTTIDKLSNDKRDAFLDYPLTIYVCDGTEDEKLEWFRIINIAGVRLTEQEMRNAIYNGPWVTDAKRYFSRVDGLGYNSEGQVSNGHTYGDYVNVEGGSKSEKENAVVRQKLFEIALEWIVDAHNRISDDKITIDDYMAEHRNDDDARGLWRYYEDVLEWVRRTFPTYHSFMKGVNWGALYNEFRNSTPADAENRVNIILQKAQETGTSIAEKEIFKTILSGDLKFINKRTFDKKMTHRKYLAQDGECPYCHRHFEEDQMHGDHKKPWSKGGKTDEDNLQMLCIECNLAKSAYDNQYLPWDSSIYNDFDLNEWSSQNNESQG